MSRFILLTILLLSYILNAQTIIWESEYHLKASGSMGIYSIIKDSDNNLVCTISDGNKPFLWSYLLKYDLDGNLIKEKIYNNEFSIMPMNLFETDFGYRIFCTVTNIPVWGFETKFLPFIINTNKEGDTIYTSMPYYFMDSKIYEDNSIQINPLSYNFSNLSTTEGKNFYNAYIKEQIPKPNEPDTYKPFHHLIVQCFDSSGKIVWRRGYDTLGYWDPSKPIPNYIILSSLKMTDENELSILMNYSKYGLGKDTLIKINITKLNLNGDIIGKIDIPVNERTQARAFDFIKLKDSTYVILIKDYDTDDDRFILWKVNNNGKIIKEKELSPKYIHDELRFIDLLEDNALLINGSTRLGTSPIYNLYNLKVDLDFNEIWDLEWNTFNILNGYTDIANILILDEHNYIVVGYKDTYNFYIAKINDETSDINDNIINKNRDLSLAPNPASNLISIKFNNENNFQNLQLKIFDIFGNEIKSIPYPATVQERNEINVDISGLQAGVYFIKSVIGSKVEIAKFVKW